MTSDSTSNDERIVERPPTIVLADGMFRSVHAKTSHALVRSTDRFTVVGVIDGGDAGRDAGEVLDGRRRGVPIYPTVESALESAEPRPQVCVVGVATGGGVVPDSLRTSIEAAIRAGLTIVNGLHQSLSDDPSLAKLAGLHGGQLIDIRKPPPRHQLRFWNGAIGTVGAFRVPVLGTDCAIGKRTTALMLRDACRSSGTSAEMIYTGQTGWLQGMRHGFILDSTPNDFVSGQLEGAVVDCWNDLRPDVIVIEGQSSLRNPSGPCGAELILSADAHGVILQHPPGRKIFLENELRIPIPSIEDEVALIRLYGVPVLAVTLSTEALTLEEARAEQERLRAALKIPVVLPLQDGMQDVVDVIQSAMRTAKEGAV